jgi:hypothetical protein
VGVIRTTTVEVSNHPPSIVDAHQYGIGGSARSVIGGDDSVGGPDKPVQGEAIVARGGIVADHGAAGVDVFHTDVLPGILMVVNSPQWDHTKPFVGAGATTPVVQMPVTSPRSLMLNGSVLEPSGTRKLAYNPFA